MQSAATTSRLGLPQWAKTDRFTRTDFTEAFAILDNTPGVQPVPNYTSLPGTLTAADHGSCFIQTDNRAMWMWYQPTVGSTGRYIRTNSLGVLAYGNSSVFITTTAKSFETAPVICTASANNIPGGRDVFIDFMVTLISMDSNFPYGNLGICRPGGPLLAQWQWEGQIGGNSSGRVGLPKDSATPGSNQVFQLKGWGAANANQTVGSGVVKIGGSDLRIYEV